MEPASERTSHVNINPPLDNVQNGVCHMKEENGGRGANVGVQVGSWAIGFGARASLRDQRVELFF